MEKRRQTDSNCPYRTLKQAYADGWQEDRKVYYGGQTLLLKGHSLRKGFKVAISRTAWKEKGFTVLAEQEPHTVVSGLVGGGSKSLTWDVFRENQVVPTERLKRLGLSDPVSLESLQEYEARQQFEEETGFVQWSG